jgi:hypothetical protein
MEFLNLSVDPLELEESIHIDDEDNEKYAIGLYWKMLKSF